MKIEHLNLVVKDLPQTLAFYQAAFPHWQVRGEGQQVWHGVARNWVHFGDDFQYLTFNDNGSGENRDLTTNELGLGHFGFETTNLDNVVKRLVQAGFSVHKDGSADEFRRNIYFLDPNGFEVEFVQYLSDQPTQRNRYDA